MGCALALPLIASLAALASADLDVGVRAEARSTTLVPQGAATSTRGALSALPRAAVILEGAGLRLSTEYAPRVWTSDVVERPSPLVDHTVGARLETHLDRPWRAEATASGTRGKTDPLADPTSVLATGPAQLPTTTPLAYEALRATALGALRLDERTTLDGGGSWGLSRGREADARALFPEQRTLGASGGASWLATPRDTLLLRGEWTRTLTAAQAGDVRSAVSSGTGTWRRRLTPAATGWLGGGASVTTQRGGAEGDGTRVLPVALAGASHERDRLGLELATRFGPAVDRYTGAVEPTAEASLRAQWRSSPVLTLAATASALARTDGETVLGTWDGRAIWALRGSLALELGVVARWQRERRPGLPSFVEGGVLTAVSYGARSMARAPARPPERPTEGPPERPPEGSPERPPERPPEGSPER